MPAPWWHLIITKANFDDLRVSVRVSEEALARELAALPVRSTDPPVNGERLRFIPLDDWRIEFILPNIFRRTLFAAVYTLIENRLNHLCKFLQRDKHLALNLKDLRGEGIDRARLYLEKVASVAFPKDAPEWEHIVAYNRLRNVIVHRDGVLGQDEGANKVRGDAAKWGDFTIGAHGEVTLSKRFCDEVIDTAESFFARLGEAVAPADSPTR